MAAFRFELDGLVFDLEFVGHPIPDCLEEVGREGLVAAIDLHVGRHHDEAWFHRPDVEVMDVLHAGDRSTFYPLSDGPSIQNHRITMTYFRTCSTCPSRS